MRKTVITLLSAAVAVVLIRLFAFSSCTIPSAGEESVLYAGDRVIVSKWSYGLRTPFMSAFGYHRIGSRPVLRGDMLIFNNPAGRESSIDSRSLFVARCVGTPGDTLMLNSELLCSQTDKTLPFVVPSRGSKVHVSPWNAKLLCNTVNRHEHRSARLRGDSLYVDGKYMSDVTFTKNYYWVVDSNIVNLSDSRLFGFVPDDHLVGRAVLVWFSKNPSEGVFSGYRWKRFFRPVN